MKRATVDRLTREGMARHINAVLLTEEGHEHLSKGRVIADARAQSYSTTAREQNQLTVVLSTCQGRQRDGNSELTLGQ